MKLRCLLALCDCISFHKPYTVLRKSCKKLTELIFPGKMKPSYKMSYYYMCNVLPCLLLQLFHGD